jgi:hypothetical protein
LGGDGGVVALGAAPVGVRLFDELALGGEDGVTVSGPKAPLPV